MVKPLVLMEKDTLDTFPSSSVPIGTFRYDPATPHRLEVWDGTTWQRLAFQSDPYAGSYAPGRWDRALKAARSLPRVDREPLTEDVSRVSRKL